MGIDYALIIKSFFASVKGLFLILALLITAYIVTMLLLRNKANRNSVTALLSTLPTKEYIVLNDIMIRSYTGVSQIDHVVISTHGIFVIETQDYHGEIVGKETDQYWTWSTGKEKHHFFNPVRQNHAHIKALETVLEQIGNVPLISVVAFPRDCELKSEPLGVLHYNELLNKIQNYGKNALTKTQAEVIAAILERANIESPEERKQYAGWG